MQAILLYPIILDGSVCWAAALIGEHILSKKFHQSLMEKQEP